MIRISLNKFYLFNIICINSLNKLHYSYYKSTTQESNDAS